MAIQVLYPCTRQAVRAFASSAIVSGYVATAKGVGAKPKGAFAKTHKSGHNNKFNSSGNHSKNNQSNFKGSIPKKDISEKPKKIKHHEFGDSLRHKFGEHNSLVNVDKLADVKRVSHKQDTFLDFKVLQEVRDFIMSQIQRNSLLYQHLRRSPKNSRADTEKEPQPTDIQKLAMAELLKERNLKNPNELKIYSIAAETGSGKTYSYLIPLINNLVKDKKGRTANLRSDAHRPILEYNGSTASVVRSVILLPTNELISQIHDAVKDASELGLTTMKLDHNTRIEDFIDSGKDVDILVTSPGKLKLLKKRQYCTPYLLKKITSPIRYCVIDEADTLLDQSFVNDTVASIQLMPMVKDLIIVAATVSNSYNKTLNKVFENNRIIRICSKKIHRISNKLEIRVINCNMKPFANSKMNALKQCLYLIYCDRTEKGQLYKKVLVFANSKESVQKVYQGLESDGAFDEDYELYTITGEDLVEDRATTMQNFNASELIGAAAKGGIAVEQSRSVGEEEDGGKKRSEDRDGLNESGEEQVAIPQSNIKLTRRKAVDSGDAAAPGGDGVKQQKVKVLITTDILARGLNFPQTGNAVLFDVPRTSADLVNRAGRVGRMGLPGRVFVLVDRSETKGWITGLPTVVRNGVPLA